MSVPTNELLLALRSPTSGWLAAMVCALEEAVQDPSFSEHHRNLVRQLLDVIRFRRPSQPPPTIVWRVSNRPSTRCIRC